MARPRSAISVRFARSIVRPMGPRQGFEVEAKGKLAALVGEELFPQSHGHKGADLVAGEGLEPPTPGL